MDQRKEEELKINLELYRESLARRDQTLTILYKNTKKDLEKNTDEGKSK